MNSLQQPTLTLRYISSQRRLNTSFRSESRSSTYRDQLYLTYENLYTRYSPFNSSSMRISQIQRSLSAKNLYKRFYKMSNQQTKTQGQDSFKLSDLLSLSSFLSPFSLRDLKTLRAQSYSPSEQSHNSLLKISLSTKLSNSLIFKNNNDKFDN